MVLRWQSWIDGGSGNCHCLRDHEYFGDSGRRDFFAVAFLFAFRAFRINRDSCPIQIWSADGRWLDIIALGVDFIGGMSIAMWNYMGWDNASTIATEVDKPKTVYPRAMILCVVLVSLTYIVPVAAMWLTGAPPSAWETGSWADLAALVGGQGLRVALVLGGMMSGFGMFNALVMSYSRLPLAMAQDGMLPQIFAKKNRTTRAPWVAIVVCAIGWALCLGLGFERLVTLDVLLYGTSLMLEFIALVALRIKEPHASPALPRAGRTARRYSCRRLPAATVGILGGARRD